MRVCGCGCGESLEGRRPDAQYASDRCRARAWKESVGYGRYDAVIAVRTANNARNGARRRSGKQLSYRKTLNALSDELGEDRARRLLEPLLPVSQRDRLAA